MLLGRPFCLQVGFCFEKRWHCNSFHVAAVKCVFLPGTVGSKFEFVDCAWSVSLLLVNCHSKFAVVSRLLFLLYTYLTKFFFFLSPSPRRSSSPFPPKEKFLRPPPKKKENNIPRMCSKRLPTFHMVCKLQLLFSGGHFWRNIWFQADEKKFPFLAWNCPQTWKFEIYLEGAIGIFFISLAGQKSFGAELK